jgi:hypothetical protein
MKRHYGFALLGGFSALVSLALTGCGPRGGATCGDGTCNGDENTATCPQDCATGTCGDGTCGAGENSTTCPVDCGASTCNDGTFDPAVEECEGGALNGETCASLGFNGGGTLACSGTCMFDTSGCLALLPDEIVYQDGLCIDMDVTRGYTPNACEVDTGCATGPGAIDILQFTLVSENIGTDTLYFGSPNNIAPPYTGLWEPLPASCGPTSGSLQFWDYAIYWLCDSTEPDCASATVHVRDGWKGSFCFIENFGDAPDWTGANASCGMYNCGNMGQQAGCADDYYVGLDCQWVDITGLADGTYTLCAWIDPTNRITELSDDNNISCKSFTLGATTATCN